MKWFIEGEPVIYINRRQSETTENGFLQYEVTEEVVENVLIGTPTMQDAASAVQIYGKNPQYTLCIPKGDTHEWTDAFVKFWGKTWHVIAAPQRTQEKLTPGPWNAKVFVEMADMEV